MTSVAAPPCEVCSSPLPAEVRFCPRCGRSLAAEANVPGERRQITVMFCDLVGSTALSRRVDPEDLREVLAACQNTVGRIVADLEGQVAQYLGDGILVYFGYPRAHEDDALRAVSAAVQIRDALPALRRDVAERFPQLAGESIQLRFGLYTGPVLVGRMGGEGRREELALGDTVNLAARLQSHAAPDEILISDTTFRLVGSAFVAEPVELDSLKGVDERVSAWRVMHAASPRERLARSSAVRVAKLVGRSSELAGLLARWERIGHGHGQALLVTGEAGVGKSRLLHALRERLGDAVTTWIECQGSALHQNSAFHPVVALLEQLVDLRRDDPLTEQIARVERSLEDSGLALRQVMPLIARLLALPLPPGYPAEPVGAEEMRERTLASLVDWLLLVSARGPAVLAVEDVHWMDVSTIELLGRLAQRVGREPVLLVMTARPDFEPPWQRVERMILSPLRPEQAEELVRHVAAGRDLPADVVEKLVERTDGVPLFVEELTRAVVEETADGGEASAEVVPFTLQGSLMARIDRLGPAKELAQIAAVLGREFSQSLLVAVSALGPATVEDRLDLIVGTGLAHCRDATRGVFAFRHALIRDVAYQSLLRSSRRRYHARVAEILDRDAPLEHTAPEVLALHCEEGGMVDRAVVHYAMAGKAAVRHSAHVEAIRHLRRAIELLQRMPPERERDRREFDLQIGLGPSLIAINGYADADAERAFARARELSGEIDAGPQRLTAIYGLSTYYQARADLKTSIELGEECLQLAEASGDAGPRMLGHLRLGLSFYYAGEHARAHAHHDKAAALYRPEEHRQLAYVHGQDLGALAAIYSALALWALGHAARARARCDEAQRLAAESEHPHTRAFVAAFSGAFHQMMREPERVELLAGQAVALGAERGFALWVGFGGVLRGWAGAVQGSGGDGAVQSIRAALEGLTRIGMVVGRTYFLGMLAEAQLAAGDDDGALASLDAALASAEATGIRYWQPELLRLRAERLGECDPVEALSGLGRALEVARAQGARALELRIALSAGRLLQRLDRAAEARVLIEPLYQQLAAEGETRDLLDARDLLASLRPDG